MYLIRNEKALPLLVEPEAPAGLRRVAGKVAGDVEIVTGVRPQIIDALQEGMLILCAVLGQSPLADRLISEGRLPEAEQIRGKWECYAICRVAQPFAGVEEALVILGSDKRGAIYGMFTFSEYIGVSPLHFFGDAAPVFRGNGRIGDDLLTVSKEPSVRYRGLFINDEWPCFGSWAMEHFGGVNAQLYDHVFELLLRLKGNYMWPAMWASVFGEEGPGSLNEELADEYGIVVGNSHHEPCLRAGEEFQHSVRAGAPYGRDWNFRLNREGITRFWADGLKRSGKYEHLITIGMRGEADSAMLGEEEGLRGNIEYLKDVIRVQEALIQAHAGPKSKDQPRLLALYKEVEPFFYGSETVPGLKDWEGLHDTVCMLCEDNHGFMRSLPTKELTETLRQRNCGWGMYYHVDYHGGPVSYEWMPSTPFHLLWEQMCMAYDYGVRDVWILNVGDLKFNEVSLKQFLDLAYDYDRWGSHDNRNWQKWVRQFAEDTFPEALPDLQWRIADLLTGLYDLNGKRRPEALHAGIYHPCHEDESKRMLRLTGNLLKETEALAAELPPCHADAFFMMVAYPARCSLNLIRMHLYAGLNAHYARQGRAVANRYAALTEAAMALDIKLQEELAAWKDGKWRGMEKEEHVGFTAWNEDGCLNPTRTIVTPWHKPRLSVSRTDSEATYGRKYGAPYVIPVHDFLDAGCRFAALEIANAGTGSVHYTVEGGAPWLSVSPAEGDVEEMQELTLYCHRELLPEEMQQATLVIRSDDAVIHVDVQAKADPKVAEPLHMPVRHVVTIPAQNTSSRHAVEECFFRDLPGYGRTGYAVKVWPNGRAFAPEEDAPSLSWRFYAEHEGEYVCEIWMTPTSPVAPGTPIRMSLTGPDGERQILTAVPADYRAGSNDDPRWCSAMLDHIRKIRCRIRCGQGAQGITIGALEPNLSIERILIYPQDHQLPQSYLGPRQCTLLAPEA